MEDVKFVEQLLGSVGKVVEVPEKLMDSVTGLSGSGPAFVYIMIEALADGGVFNGLPRDKALEIATQVVLGAATMIQETGLHPAMLKDMVASPGGTTIAGIKELEARGFRSAVTEAVNASTAKAVRLGKL
jgi:pyrroline-5-carboxylate reductase